MKAPFNYVRIKYMDQVYSNLTYLNFQVTILGKIKLLLYCHC